MNGKAAILIGSETDRATIEASKKYFDYFFNMVVIFVLIL